MTDETPTENAPTLVIGFKRLEELRRVLEATAAASLGDIYVLLDQARPERSEESRACSELQSWVRSWAAENERVHVNVAGSNMGVARAIPAGIDWVLSEGHDAVIVLEDDCLPAPDFFTFMQEMLTYYRDDDRVMMISGNQFLPDREVNSLDASYYFSRFIHIWGWATWARAWKYYDHDLTALDSNFVSQNLEALFPGDSEQKFYEKIWRRQRSSGDDNAWASRWLLACLLSRGLCICPARNLARNIGFGEDGTNTRRASKYQIAPLQALVSPLKHPQHVMEWRRADRWWFQHLISKRPLPRIRRYLLAIEPESVEDQI